MPDTYRILLVDDDKDTCEMMSMLLTLDNSAYEVISATTADEALALLEVQKFDFYILDSLIYNKSGIELCKRIRRTDHLTPVMFYSGFEEINYIRNAKAAGANEYLVKPDDLDKLTETVGRYLI